MRYQAEMGFTRSELLKGLPSAVAPYMIMQEDRYCITAVGQNRVARILLGEERLRTIASISLPVIDVIIEFENFSRQDYAAFVERFRKYLHRGGG